MSADSYSRATLSEKEARMLALFWAHLRYWGWQVFSKLVLGIVYLGIVSEGARRLIPSLGQKIYKLVPFLERLDHRIDAAHCFALFLLVGCWSLWSGILQVWLGHKPYSRETWVVFPLALVFITVDTVMFYFATAQWRWGGSLWSFTALLATAGYVAVLVFVTFVGIGLKQEIKKAKS